MKPISAHHRLFVGDVWPPCSAHRETLWDRIPRVEAGTDDPLATARGLVHAICLMVLAGEVLGLLMWGGVL